jgi:hypothetical protein
MYPAPQEVVPPNSKLLVKDLPTDSTYVTYEYNNGQHLKRALESNSDAFFFLRDFAATDCSVLKVDGDGNAVVYGVAMSAMERTQLRERESMFLEYGKGTWLISNKTGEKVFDFDTMTPDYKHWSVFPTFNDGIKSIMYFDCNTKELVRSYNTDNITSAMYAISWMKCYLIKPWGDSAPKPTEHGVRIALELIYRTNGIPPCSLSIADIRTVCESLTCRMEPLPDRYLGAFSRLFYEAINIDKKESDPPDVIILPPTADTNTGTVRVSELISAVFKSRPGDPDKIRIEMDMTLDPRITGGYCRNNTIYLETTPGLMTFESMEEVMSQFPDPDQVIILTRSVIHSGDDDEELGSCVMIL